MNIKEIDKKLNDYENRTYVCTECLEVITWKKVTKTNDGPVCEKCIVSYQIGKLDDMAVASGVITNEERVIKQKYD